MTDVVIIGAGPAGLAAATSARALGAHVVLLDSADQLGGQYWRHLPTQRPSKHEAGLHHGWAKFQKLCADLVADPDCRILTQAQVWAITAAESSAGTGPASTGSATTGSACTGSAGTDPATTGASARNSAGSAASTTSAVPTVHVLVGEPDGVGRERLSFSPDAIVLANGAHDRALPFPGWDLPGVFTAGAAQALAKSERIAVGDRVLVAGAGPFLLPVAASLAQVGATVLGVLEANHMQRIISGWGKKPWQLIGAASKGAELAGYARNHIANRIPYLTGRGVVAAHGTERVTHVTTAKLDTGWAPIAGTEKTVAVDAVCIGHGFTPRLELAIAAGCALTAERFVRVDAHQRTTVPGVYAAGELTAIGGVDAALVEGTIAGHAAAGGHLSDPAMKSQVAKRITFSGFARRIEKAHGIRAMWPGWLTDDTIICRCEEVNYGAMCQTAQATESTGLRSLKLSTRAGLGLCQGRVCGRTVEELLACQTPGGLSDGVMTDRRPIAAPVRIADLAAAALPASPGRNSPQTASPSKPSRPTT
ncbi:FAD-dependent oxidoreductase [Homoserinimonas sp. OAct 916]|uniref:FAD-dependent oxidoreductase n=1 Tax=Homoserinimonas sp. OAct 916 TaxID=2211450 RepID=UPI000DBE9EBD|nr:FAD-dependent oxidoreductase [Homoserinimonas sp. OAct 916]